MTLRVGVVLLGPPDPFATAPAGWYYAVVKGLSERGHRVTCFAPYKDEASAERSRRSLAGHSVDLRLYPLVKLPFLRSKWQAFREPCSYSFSPAMRGDVAAWVREGYDILHLDQAWSGYLGVGVERSLLCLHQLLTLDYQGLRVGTRWQRTLLRLMCRAERQLARRFPAIRIESEPMRRQVAAWSPRTRLFDIPCAIDTSLYEYRTPTDSPPVIGFTANMRWHLGQWAAERLITSVFPRVRRRVPDATLLLVGWDARQVLAAHLDTPGVEVHENVPDMEPYFRRLSVLTYPLLQGSGLKTKIMEAMAYGLPVVTTTAGMEGMAVDNGVHAFVSDDDEVMAEHVASLLTDLDRRRAMSARARALVEADYSVASTVRKLEVAYEAIGGSR